ncbi:DUF3515 domain-containing protein [Microbacterium sp. Marseille-Q6965]|uniref:DUF3515 domain-containing protein n=1 Tax=Microbacterium sp. Marseille-Q6965 TaxID=2965072 RepID=UPI0021B80FC3|nr:DUF3515 domain-containing protein [Microbacterium sp. Marseille-Q6965]
MIRRPLATSARVAALLAGALALGGCATTVHLPAEPLANDPLCAEVSVRLPDALGDLPRLWTDAQATAVWGEDQEVIFSCGLEPLAPSTLQCVSIGGVDWVVDDSDFPRLRMATYGRSPAAAVLVDTAVDADGRGVSSNDVLSALSGAVSQLEQTGACVAPDEAEYVG